MTVSEMSKLGSAEGLGFDLGAWLKKQSPELNMTFTDLAPVVAGDRREWLITNGLGSYASASLSGANTRSYHGLFVAALEPPVSRTVMLSRIDEIACGQSLATNYWSSGDTAPMGYKSIVACAVYPVPTFVFRLPQGYLVKQIAMLPREQKVFIGYSYIADAGAGNLPKAPAKDQHSLESHSLDSSSIDLQLHLLANYRDFHSQTRGSADWQFAQSVCESNGETKLEASAFEGASKLKLKFDGGYQMSPDWWWNYSLPRETERGLPNREDLFHLGIIDASLKSGESITVCVSLAGSVDAVDMNAQDDKNTSKKTDINDIVRKVVNYQNELISQAAASSQVVANSQVATGASASGGPKLSVSNFQKQLILAGDQFLVQRKSSNGPTVIAGYHWFNDWGRDTMISLTGLALATGRYAEAKGILNTFAKYISDGMLPNNFPDQGQNPDYNTVDATLWWAYALKRYEQATGDSEFVYQQLPLLDSVIDWHKKGTRYGIKVDETNGLLSEGQEGFALTWMDARVGDYVVTPRRGKAVEINALWYHFLKTVANWHRALSDGFADSCEAMAQKVKENFGKFWNAEAGCLYDLIDVPSADGSKVVDASIRPNQLFALSLADDLVTKEQAASIIAGVEGKLVTPVGLRTLSPVDHNYKPFYGGGGESANQYQRDITYHQGTVWPWLLGALVDARIKHLGKSAESLNIARGHLKGIEKHLLEDGCMGSINEIFDGDYPHTDRGCVAQAWSVAEILRLLADYPELY